MEENIIRAIQSVVGLEPCVLHAPVFAGREREYVLDCIDTTFVSSVGAYVNRIEVELARYTEAKYAVAVVNGTAALHVALLLCGVIPGDEVLMPSLTFIATANAISYCGATPHFIDSEEVSLGVDAVKLDQYLSDIVDIQGGVAMNRRTGKPIRAIVPMHVFGHPVDLDRIVAVADKYCIKLIEDAAESIGSYYKGKHTGHHGVVACLSFNGNKTITTGGGGAIITNDESLAKKAKHLTTTAKIPHRWDFRHDMIGFNYRMPNINAALGCAQIEQLDGFIRKKRLLAEKYKEAFAQIPDVRFIEEPSYSRSNYWLNAIQLLGASRFERDKVLDATNQAGIMTRPCWELMSSLPMYSMCPSMNLDVAERITNTTINIPSSASLIGDSEVE